MTILIRKFGRILKSFLFSIVSFFLQNTKLAFRYLPSDFIALDMKNIYLHVYCNAYCYYDALTL